MLSDICNLPFRDKVFEMVYAFNVVEHVNDRDEAIKELNRVGDRVIIRFDKISNLANWLTSDHVSVAIEDKLRPFPKPMKWMVRLVRFPIDHSKFFQNMVHKTFPALRKMGMLDEWNYYEIQ